MKLFTWLATWRQATGELLRMLWRIERESWTEDHRMDKTTTTTTTTETDTAHVAAPYEGEQLMSLVYHRPPTTPAGYGLWLYPASYSDPRLALRRANHLSEAHGVPFFACRLASYGGDWVPYTPERYTTKLVASAIPLPPVDPVTLAPAWEDSDTEAHVRETVDELARGE